MSRILCWIREPRMRYLFSLREILDKIVPSSRDDVFDRDLCTLGSSLLHQKIILVIWCLPEFFRSDRACECHIVFEMLIPSSWGDVFNSDLRAQGSGILHHKVILTTWFSQRNPDFFWARWTLVLLSN